MSDVIRDTGLRCRNWGKWGPDDERGTLNYIGPDTIVEAATLVKRGVVFSLAIPFDSKGPQPAGGRRFNPIHRMTLTGPDCTTGAVKFPGGAGFTDDIVVMPPQCATQWDALSHCLLDGQLYNGYDANDVSSRGARRLGVEKISRGIVGRAVLADVPRTKGLPWLEPGYAITAADLEAALGAGRVALKAGDVLLVRTGMMTMCRERGSWGDYVGGPAPGLSITTADWVHRQQLSAIATDTWAMEVQPHEVPDSFQPLHQVFIVNMGLTIGEIFQLDELADDCARDGVYACFFAAPPLPITGAVGSPINPLAIK
jgi:kynurenine formamidase